MVFDKSVFGPIEKETGLNLKEIIAQALRSAITEIIPPIVSRTVRVALRTTKEISFKDFCCEPNEHTFLRGTLLMMEKLSGSLASVTCREPLVASFTSNLNNLLL
jgi:CCR4-NOT transcription complex subunit 1